MKLNRRLWIGVVLVAVLVVDAVLAAEPGVVAKKKKKSKKSKKVKVPKIQADAPQTERSQAAINYPDPEYDYPTYYDEKEDYDNENGCK